MSLTDFSLSGVWNKPLPVAWEAMVREGKLERKKFQLVMFSLSRYIKNT